MTHYTLSSPAIGRALSVGGISPSEKLVLVSAVHYSARVEAGREWPSQADVADELGLNKKTVREAYKKLEALGYIDRQSRYASNGHRLPDHVVVNVEAMNPPATPAAKANRKAVTRSLALAVFDRDGYACKHCGTRQSLTVDHVIPVSRGGSDEMDNLQTLCGPCNSIKGATLPQDA